MAIGFGGVGVQAGEGHNTSKSILEDYLSPALRLNRREIKDVKRTAMDMADVSPDEALAYLSGKADKYVNFRPFDLERKLRQTPYDAEKGRAAAEAAYQDVLGRAMSGDEWQRTKDYAAATGVKSGLGLERIAMSRLGAGGYLLSPEAEQWQLKAGNIPRDENGKPIYGMIRYNPEKANQMAADSIKSITAAWGA
jgi:hypothetical protein